MPKISLTDFVDVVSASGTPKATKVSQIKNRRPYQPAFDFYKPIRDHITEIHQNNRPKVTVRDVLRKVNDPKKLAGYPALVDGYTRWWGRKSFTWFNPPDDLFSLHGVDVSVNPELGLKINGQPHLIKIYFKADPLSKNKIDIITHLMETCLSGQCPSGTIMSVLDLRRARQFSPTVPIATLDAILGAELAYIAALWSNV